MGAYGITTANILTVYHLTGCIHSPHTNSWQECRCQTSGFQAHLQALLNRADKVYTKGSCDDEIVGAGIKFFAQKSFYYFLFN
jgi:hypothetical protein